MAAKNNFSKAVLDLMGLPGNESPSGAEPQDAVSEAIFEQNRRPDMTIGRESDFEKRN